MGTGKGGGITDCELLFVIDHPCFGYSGAPQDESGSYAVPPGRANSGSFMIRPPFMAD